MNSTLTQEIPQDHDDRISRTQRLTADTGPPAQLSAWRDDFSTAQQPGAATES